MKNIILTILITFISFAEIIAQKNDSIKSQTIDEVVIQATKINLSEHQSPVSASLLKKESLEMMRINNIEELNARIPNLFIPEHGSRLTSPIYIRGIGSRINSQAVGLYVDNIPYFELGSFNFELYNLSKIEVLRGPQGTLYGRNTMGGLISVYSAELSEKQEISLQTDYGNYNRIKSVVHYNQSLSDKIIFALDGAYTHSDGFFKNIFLNNSADAFNTYSGRLKFRYIPTSKLKINLNVSYERNLENGYPYAVYDTTNQTASDVNYNQLSTYHRDLLSSGLNINYKAGKFELNSASSFQFLTDTQRIDQDFTPKDLFFVDQNREHQTFVQEFTLKSLSVSKIKWVAGLFGFKQLKDKNVNVYYGKDAVAAYHLPGPIIKLKNYNQPTQGAAAYGQISIPFYNFSLSAGIRADYEKDNLKYNYDRMLNDNLTQIQDADTFNTFYQILPKVTLTYKINDGINTYFSIAKGYKTGGFNSTFERDEDISFNPEFSYNYELGVKTRLMNGKFSANADIFYIDWKDQQVYQPVPSGHGAMLKNAGHSVSKGIEAEIKALPVRNIQIWFNTGYNDVRYLDYVKDENTDYSGNIIPYIPQYTGNIGFSYNLPLSGSFFKSVMFLVDYQYIGKFYWNDANTAYQNSYGLLNANISVNTNKHIQFGVFGKNLLNADYNSYFFEALGNSYVQLGNPMQINAFVKLYF
ncbi:MAG: TonB-dependent receptor [Chlorobi bacterium]|nr:TonB-dependent receptor [Chlorobiota bacterium]